MPELHKKQWGISAFTIILAFVTLVAFWQGLQIAARQFLADSLYLEFVLLRFPGFGFPGISYLFKVS